jgi:5-methylcytosine-specific restriction endonuclease McrA
MYQDLPALKQHKLYLKDFRDSFRDIKDPRGHKTFSIRSKKETIDALVKLGEVRLFYRNGHTRKKFDKAKHKHKYLNGFPGCFACRGRAEVRHHIIWLSHGGRNQKNNIIALCKSCHAEIHPWLKKT